MTSIKLKVIILVLLMVLPVVLLGIAGTLYYQGIIKQNIWDDNLAQAKTIAILTPEYMGMSQLYLKSIADRPQVSAAVHDKDISFLKGLAVYVNNTSRIDSVYFTDINGTIIATTPPIADLTGEDMSGKPCVGEVLRSGRPYMSDVEMGWDKMPSVAIGVPIMSDNNTVVGTMVGSFDMGDFAETVLDAVTKHRQYTYLVNRTGHIFIHQDLSYVRNMTDYSSVPAVQSVLRGESGVMENYNPVEHDLRLAAYAPMDTTGWGVVIAMPVSVAYEPIQQATQWMLAIITAFTALAILIGLYVGHSIADPITKLSAAVKMAGETEDYHRMLPLGSDDEIGDLARSFDGMIKTIKQDIAEMKRTGDALRKGQFILAKSQEIGRLGNWAWNVQTGEIRGSAENDRIFGFEPGQVKQTPEWLLSRTFEEDRNMLKDFLDASGKLGKPGNIDFRIVMPDGSIRYVNMVADKIVPDKAGNIKWIYGISQDITPRKQAEESMKEAKERAELYLDLMGHDINNINQVAMGYLELARDQLSMGEEDKELITTPLDALKSSANLIENVRKLQHLKEGDLKTEQINLVDVLSSLRDEYLRTIPDDLVIRYDPPARCTVVANGLVRDVFSNLIGNAVRHSGGQKPVEIDILQDSMTIDGKDYCRIAVEDNGPGIPDSLKPRLFHRFQRGDTQAHGKGLGLYLVRTLVEDYHGKAWVEDRVPGDPAKGARFVVMLPMAKK